MITTHLRGHPTLADMVNTHIGVWRNLLLAARNESPEFEVNEHGTRPGADRSYFEHELRALADIEAACAVEMSK